MTARPGIFISYRREDAAGDAGRLADHLQRRLRHARVLLDVDVIAPGTDFTQVLKSYLQETAAVLVVIGPRWTSVLADDGARRLDQAGDLVRFEVEAALARDVLVVPVLVQGATMPRAEDLPPSLAPLVHRQAVTLDHAEFHADVERLCRTLAAATGGTRLRALSGARRWLPGAALAVALAWVVARQVSGPASRPVEKPNAGSVAAERASAPDAAHATAAPIPAVSAAGALPSSGTAVAASTAARPAKAPVRNDRAVPVVLAEVESLRRRNQLVEALAALARARELAPTSAALRDLQEDVAMQRIRQVRVESGKSLGDAIKPALAVVDGALPSATGVRRADLQAHRGWAAFLLWRGGDRQLDPAQDYREALAVDPSNPYANAMLAHWTLGRRKDLPAAVKLFETAARARRDLGAVRRFQFPAYENAATPEARAQHANLADAMRRGGETLGVDQGFTLWSTYSYGIYAGHKKERQALLAALPPDDHISTLNWALDQHPSEYELYRDGIRYYVALLNISAGHVERARDDLRALEKKLATSSGSLPDAVQAALKSVSPELTSQTAGGR